MTSVKEPETFWIRTQTDYRHYHYTCSNCHIKNRYHKYPFCPHCGKKMATDVVLNEKGDVI